MSLARRSLIPVGSATLRGHNARSFGSVTIDELDKRLVVYHDDDGWRRFTLPQLQAMGARKVAEAIGISERRARDILKGRAMPHPGHKSTLERLVTLGSDDSPQTLNTYARPPMFDPAVTAPTRAVSSEMATETPK
jgi:hypothetical protein